MRYTVEELKQMQKAVGLEIEDLEERQYDTTSAQRYWDELDDLIVEAKIRESMNAETST